MTTKKTKTEVAYTAAQMFDLVADVEKYPEFLPWCRALRVVRDDVEDGHGTLLADMVVAYQVFRERFRSRVEVNKVAGTVDATYVNGPFRNLENHWRFTDLPGGGSQIDFEITFEFRSVVLQTTAVMVFERAFARMSEAFVARADEVYGNLVE